MRVKTSAIKMIKSNYQQVLFVFIAFLAMVMVSYFYVSDIVRKQILDLSEQIMETTQTAVSANLTESELLFSNVVQTVEGMVSTDKTNQDILGYLTDTNTYFDKDRSSLPYFMKIYGYINGEFLDGSGWIPPDDYVPAERPWYIGADNINGEIFFSEPYTDAETGGMCISFSQEIFDQENNSYGIMAIDLKLESITEYIRNQKIANNGYGVLVDDKMNFTTHKDTSLEGVSIFDAGGGYAKLGKMIQEEESVVSERFMDNDGVESIAFFRTIFNGWHVGLITPYSSYYKQVTVLATVLGILGFVLMVILSCIIVRIRVQKIKSDEENMSKSTFLARMSHEMRTPMNAIIGMTSIAKESDDPDKVYYCLKKIDEASNHLLGVINDVLDMSKIEAGKLELSESEFIFKNMVEQVCTVVGYKIEEKHQNFNIQIDENIPYVIKSDRQRLAQVITNLIGNANKFTEVNGEINLRISLTETENKVCTIKFEVEDNGIGISDEQSEKLFKSFEQADGSISRRYGGTGLGLSISKKIVDIMDGKIWVESELGKGSKFIFIIKAGVGDVGNIEDDIVKNKLENRNKTENIFKGKHLLLAEDVEINREILIELLSDTGIEIECAENGREAVEKFSLKPEYYDIIFMDIHMPELDGYEATRQIRAMNAPKAGSIPIVAMTANVFKEDIEKCYDAGMNAHTGKPIEIEDVFQNLYKFLFHMEINRNV